MSIPKRQYLEVTTAVQPTEHLVRQHLQATGGSFSARGTHRDPKTKQIVSVAVANEHSDTIAEFAALICSRVAAKASLKYPRSTTLLVNCDLGEVVLEDEWEEILQAVRSGLSGDQAVFLEVVLVHQANRPAVVASRTRARRPNKKRRQSHG